MSEEERTASTTDLELGEERPANDKVVRWRELSLRRAGYGERAAAELARRPDVDLHRAIDLVRKGCPPDLAYRILA